MGKVNYVKRWYGRDFNDPAVRKRFIRHLKRWHNEFTTPWWRNDFNLWIVYEATIHPCGLEVKSIDSSFVTLCAHCEGVQSEGICLNATFKVPVREFETKDLVRMIGPYRYHKHGPACRFVWFPDDKDPRIDPTFITELAWWYDGFYNETE